ncbi:amino acid transporter [Candidatus Nitrososphaera gargensis Ga9.2]|uniref:Amino acid transporter n=1 Tax=Nitrososphaera gargensis (strain Ga9.2) TaxID=1237085 RepID=K0IC81_NITGG|nr:amino acid transporter [Candidatus Nitrososphaera gargensis Ga9.2]
MKVGEQKEPGLKRNINLFQAVMYGVGLILGAGIYVLIGDVAGIAGNAMWISFVIAAVIATFTGLSYAELSSMFPKSAAEYVFAKNAFKNNLVAFITGWLITFVAVASAAAVAIGFSGYLASFLPQFDPVLSAVALLAALSAINFIGIRESVWMNTTFTLIELAGLAIVVLAAVLLGSFAGVDYYELPPAASTLSLSVGAIIGAAGLVFFAYYGFENLANISEETKNAPRTIPKALIISIAVTTGVYILIAVSAIALVGWEALSSTGAPLALAAEKAFGRPGVTVLSAIALFATSNTVLMMLIAGSRIMYGMSRERALPAVLGRVHPATKTPWIAVVLMMLLTSAMVVFSRGSISAVANIAVFAIFMVYALVNLALIWLRHKQPELERPFRSPVRIGWFPVLAGLGFITSLAMLSQFDSGTMIAGAATVAIGLASYAAIERYRSKRYS